MWVTYSQQIGFDTDSRTDLGAVRLDPLAIGTVSSYAGSNHILSLGQHFDDYVLDPHGLPSLPVIPGFPTAHPFKWLSTKLRSNDVLGNFGEAIAAIVSVSTFHLSAQDVAHLAVLNGKKTPDYIMRFGGALPPGLSAGKRAVPAAMPDWWPVESKSGGYDSDRNSQVKRAFRQLASYWRLVAPTNPGDVGFGIVFGFKHRNNPGNPPHIVIAIFLPSDQPALSTYLQSVSDAEWRKEKKKEIDDELIGRIYGCS